MKKKHSLLALFASAFLWCAFPNDPPNGNTGAPGESTCMSCHTLDGNTQDGIVTVTGMPSVIEPCTQYMLTVTSSNPNGVASGAGFQLTILNSNNQMSGTISAPSAGSRVQTESGRQYWEHTAPASYPVSNVVSWTAMWLSPSSPSNTTVTYFVANNVVNLNGFDTGDLVVTATGGGTLNGGAPTLTALISNTSPILCNGQNTGSATAGQSGGVAPFTYHWSNGSNNQTINNLTAGTYTVTVTDNCSSTSTSSAVIGQPAQLGFTAPSITNVLCNGGSTGAITAHAGGGVTPYQFNWSTGTSGASITNRPAGGYTVTVTDNNGCTTSMGYQITQPAIIAISLVDLTHESCFGEEDGSITISNTGGAGPLFAEWSNGSVGTTINNLAPDTYTVVVTDNNDCTKSANFTINAGGVVTVNLNQIQNVTCPGGNNGSISVTATGGIAPYTYSWSNGTSGSVVSGLAAASYFVTVSDSQGCDQVKTYTVNEPQDFNIQIQQTSQNLCFGNSTADLTSSVTGGTLPYTSAWSNGVNGSNNSNLPAGTYTLTVTDNVGCTSTNTWTIVDPAQVTVTVSVTDESGVGLNNGSAAATPTGGTGAYTFLWSNGGTTSTITNLAPGIYTVTVTDINACSNSAAGQVDPFGCLLDLQLGNDVIFCEGGNALLLPSVNGESGIVTYIWSDGSTADSLLVTQPGEYCLTVTDEAGCQDLDCIVIVENIIPDFTCPVINESAPGAHDGMIQCDAISGNFTFLWNTGASTPSITNLSPGVYCLTITDEFGCTKDTCFNVQSGSCQLSITTAQTNVLCAGDSTGSITIAANNVTAPVLYSWSNGGSTAVLNNLPAGNYSVTVSDATGCFATDDFTITSPDSIVIVVDTVIDVTIIEGLIQVTISGGVSPYTYLWTFPGGSQQAGIEDLTNLTVSGNYNLEVTDANGCVISSGNIFVDMHVAVNPVEKFKSLRVYPVPSDDVLIVEIDKPITEVLISGVEGRLIKRMDHPASNHLDINDLQNGWYIIRIFDGKNWYITRFVK